MFPPETIKSIYEKNTALSDQMIMSISKWEQMYFGKAPWTDKNIYSLRLEQAIVRELANVSLNEMTAKVSNERLDKVFQSSVKNLNKSLQKGLATGAMVIKPVGKEKVQCLSQSEFIPVEYDVNGKLTKVIFPEIKKVSEQETFIRLEFHSLDFSSGLTITNKAFHSFNSFGLGKEIPLKSLSEWAGLESEIHYPMMLRNAFGYYANPIDNTVDGSHGGVSAFACAENLIRTADEQFGRLNWEFESAERRIDIDEQAIKIYENSGYEISRIYRKVDSENLFREFSPAVREANFIAGLEEYKRNIEFAVGLSYGDISNPQTVDKTATEIKASKARKYNTVSAIQNNLRTCLDDFVYSLAFYNALTTSGYEFICDFRDSILTDEDTERQRDMQDVSAGIMRPEEYRAKWYGETLETALKNLPQSAQVLD